MKGLKNTGAIMENVCDKFDFEKAYDKYQDYIYYQQCTKTKYVRNRIREYEKLMRTNLATGKPYKESDRLLDLLERHLALEHQRDELLGTNILSRAGKKLSRINKKALRRSRVLAKCNTDIAVESGSKAISSTYKTAMKPISGTGKLASATYKSARNTYNNLTSKKTKKNNNNNNNTNKEGEDEVVPLKRNQ